MVIEPGHETPDFFAWIGPALATWLLIGLILGLAGIGLALLFAIVSRGPGPGYRTVAQRLREGTADLLSTSPRRILALAQLSVKEAVRKKVFVALVLFAIIIAAAAWYMTPGAGNQPATLYLDFVLFWAITVPVLVVAVFLAAFSLPGEIANRTIYTVVTKPVRPTEIVLGRIVGFTAIGSVMLLVMGIVSYIFVIRTLSHTHNVPGTVVIPGTAVVRTNLSRFKVVGGEQADRMAFRGRTGRAQGHEHEVQIDIATGVGQTNSVNQHRHPITQRLQGKKGKWTECQAESVAADVVDASAAATRLQQQIRVFSNAHGLAAGDVIKLDGVLDETDNDIWVVETTSDDSFTLKDSRFCRDYSQQGGDWQQVRYEVGPPQDFITARVPRLAHQMQFLGRDGNPGQGINVGTEWDYRKAVEGGTLSAVDFHFEGLRKSDADENGNLRLQMTLGVFRTLKLDIETPIPGNIELLHPDGDFVSDKMPFSSNEYVRQELIIPKQQAGYSKKSTIRRENATLFDDYVSDDGKLIVRISVHEPMQYLTMAQRDVYFLAGRANPALNFVKGCISIWFQLILVTSLAVAFSTFLNGFVALLSSGGVLFASLLIDRVREVADRETPGGASFESFFRVLTRAPMTTQPGSGFLHDFRDRVFRRGGAAADVPAAESAARPVAAQQRQLRRPGLQRAVEQLVRAVLHPVGLRDPAVLVRPLCPERA